MNQLKNAWILFLFFNPISAFGQDVKEQLPVISLPDSRLLNPEFLESLSTLSTNQPGRFCLRNCSPRYEGGKSISVSFAGLTEAAQNSARSRSTSTFEFDGQSCRVSAYRVERSTEQGRAGQVGRRELISEPVHFTTTKWNLREIRHRTSEEFRQSQARRRGDLESPSLVGNTIELSVNRIYVFEPEGRTDRQVFVNCRKTIPPHSCRHSPRQAMSNEDADEAFSLYKSNQVTSWANRIRREGRNPDIADLRRRAENEETLRQYRRSLDQNYANSNLLFDECIAIHLDNHRASFERENTIASFRNLAQALFRGPQTNLDQLFTLDYSQETRDRINLRNQTEQDRRRQEQEEENRRRQEVDANPNRGIANEKKVTEEI